MDAHDFLKTLTVVLGVAAVTTVVFQRLKQPVVLGYIIAGLVIGPHLAVPLNADPQTVQTLSELGVILLMFAIGLELSIAKLARVGPTAGVIGVVQVALMIWAGYVVGKAFGWTDLEGVFAGAAIAISSTTIIAKVFEEQKVDESLRELVYGILIVEDILAILLLATMTTVASGSGLAPAALAVTTAKLLAFLVAMIVIGLLVVPPAARMVVRLGRPETTLVASIGLCFGLAYLAHAFGYSVALGAFVAGTLISESGEGNTVEHVVTPVRDMFAAIFFVSVGMLIDPALVVENAGAVAVLTVVVIVGKLVGVALGSLLTGASVRTSVQTGMSLAQIGEFSFIIVALGQTLGATRPFLYPVAVAVSAITTLTTPALIGRSGRIAAFVAARVPKRLAAFVALYGVWLARVRETPRPSRGGSRAQRAFVLLAADVTLLVVVLLCTGYFRARITRDLGVRFALEPSAANLLVVGTAAVLSAPLLFGIVRLSRTLALSVTGSVVDDASAAGDATRRIAVVVQLGMLTAVGVICVMAVEPFLPTLPGALLLVAIFVVAGVAFVRYVDRFDAEVQAGLEAFVTGLKTRVIEGQGEASAVGDVGPREPGGDVLALLPGLGMPTTLRVEASSPAVGQSLAELDLRARTGASILLILRDGATIPLPSADERLLARDVLGVVGDEQALARARTALGLDAA